jgi:Tol biopolymer transport system component
MKRLFLFSALVALYAKVIAQNMADSNFVTIVTTLSWVPDGKDLLLSVVRFDKTRKTAPVSKGFIYNLASRQLSPSGFAGNSPAASPDGKTIVFIRRKENNKADIYLFDRINKRETALVVDTFAKNSPGWSGDGRKIV